MTGGVLLQGFRRLAVIYAGVVAATIVVSALLGLAAGAGVLRSMAVGFYVAGAVFLLGCFVMGARGPLRGQGGSGETVAVVGARRIRRATPDERSEAARTAILLFALGLTLIVLGALIDPAHKAF